VEGEALMPPEPCDDLGALVGRIVVEHDVDRLVCRDRVLEGVQELDELLMSVALPAAPGNAAFEHVQGSGQGCGAVPLVVMRRQTKGFAGHGAAATFSQRQAGAGCGQAPGFGFSRPPTARRPAPAE